MFVTDKLVFLELHKTGGTHIGKWLSEVVDGRQVGKHNRLPENLRDRFIVGSVRNPWDWYVSLWAYGCSHRGSVSYQTTRRFSLKYYWDGLPREMGRRSLSPPLLLRQFVADAVKPVAQWSNSYTDSQSPKHFQRWLKLMLDPSRRYDIGEGYGFSDISKAAGLLSYRFLKLFTSVDEQLYQDHSLANYEYMRKFWDENQVTSYIIRNENLEADLLCALDQAFISYPETYRDRLIAASNRKTNVSERKSAGFYYDEECIELVANKDKLIIDLFDYCPPSV